MGIQLTHPPPKKKKNTLSEPPGRFDPPKYGISFHQRKEIHLRPRGEERKLAEWCNEEEEEEEQT